MKLGAFVSVFSLTVFTAYAAVGYRQMEFDSGNFKVMWMYDNVADNLTFHLEVKTVGWVGFGFALTAPNSMVDYDVVIGGVTAGGASYLNDYYTAGRSKPPQDDSQDYTLINAAESGGWTRLNFTRKADTGDQKDIKITAGDKIHLIWAYHTSGDVDNTNFAKHSVKGLSNKVEILEVPTTQPPTPTIMAYTNVLTMDGGNYKAQWNYDQAKKEYSFYLKVKTTGWVAFGFAKVAPNNMQGYDVAIGGVTSNGTAYINDFYTTGRTRPAVDQSNDFTLVKGVEKEGYTELWFTRKADTGDAGKDLTLTAGTKVFIVWGYNTNSDADNTNTFARHTNRGVSAANMDLSSGQPTTSPGLAPTTMAYTKTLTMDGGNYKAQWNYDNTKKEYSFYLKVKTTGWVAFGFAKVAPNNMQGYDVAIGGVTSGGTAYINDFYTSGRKLPAVDQSNDFTLVKGVEKGGYTELWFTRKADTGDSGKDLTLTAGTKVFIVWAYNAKSDADNTNSFTIHSKRGFSAAKLGLSSGGTGGVSLVTYSFVAIAANLFIAVRGFL